MKKLTVLLVILSLTLSAFIFTSCAPATEEMTFGIGYSADNSMTSADGATAGEANVALTVAATLFDKDGKLVACVIDVADNSVSFTSAGVATVPSEFKTKRELGDSYGMVEHAGSELEWYEQADAFAAAAVGKTLAEIKALMATSGANAGKGNDDVIAAGCTIYVSEFVKAIENSVKDTKTVNVARDDAKITLTVTSSADAGNATDAANGKIDFEIGISASVAGTDAAATYTYDCEFDKSGAAVK